jgi:glycosyltransferase involved in cell wall biosynthesis
MEEQYAKLRHVNLRDDVQYVESPTHKRKVAFLQSIDLLSVPTTYREPKGIYILEALVNGVPVVQPRHGSFPELIEATGGGILVEPDNPQALAEGLLQLLKDSNLRKSLGERGKQAVFEKFSAERMAQDTMKALGYS